MKIFVSSVLALAFLMIPTSAKAEPVLYEQADESPDYVLVTSNAPEGTKEATDLEWIRIVQDSESKPHRVKIVFKVDDYDGKFFYEAGVIVSSEKRGTGQIFGMSDSNLVYGRTDLAGDGYYCPNGSKRVKGNRIILRFTHFCAPFRYGTLRPYVNTYARTKALSPAGADGFKTVTREFDFTYN